MRPATPAITDTNPDPPANENQPEVKGTAPAGTTVRIYGDSTCAGPILGSGPAARFSGVAGITATDLPGDQTTGLRATATGANCLTSACSDPFPYIEDSTAPPAPSITSTSPTSPGADETPQVIGQAPGDATLVKLHEGFAICADPFPAMGSRAQFEGAGISVPVNTNGPSRLYAQTEDAAGNESACSSPFDYTHDSLAPDTTITSGPPAQTSQRKVTIEFTASEGSSFACRIDAGAFAPCTSPFRTPRLAIGKHKILVQATDLAGNPDPAPAKRRVKIVR